MHNPNYKPSLLLKVNQALQSNQTQDFLDNESSRSTWSSSTQMEEPHSPAQPGRHVAESSPAALSPTESCGPHTPHALQFDRPSANPPNGRKKKRKRRRKISRTCWAAARGRLEVGPTGQLGSWEFLVELILHTCCLHNTLSRCVVHLTPWKMTWLIMLAEHLVVKWAKITLLSWTC